MVNREHTAHKLLLFIAGTFIVCWAAFLNGYPLVFSDTGSYITYGFWPDGFLDRPYTYSWFIKHVSLRDSYWLVVWAQSAIVFYLLKSSLRYFLPVQRPYLISVGIAALLAWFTNMSFFAGQLLPDIFSAVLLLAFALVVLLWGNLKTRDKIIFPLLVVLSAGMHFSNLMTVFILTVIVVLTIAVQKIRRRTLTFGMPAGSVVATATALAFLLVPAVNYMLANRFMYTDSSHVFIMGRLSENGILKKFLDENCTENKYRICACKDNLPKNATDFVWDAAPGSAVSMAGGWYGSKPEFDEIIGRTFLSGEYFKSNVLQVVKGTVKQFFSFSIENDFGPYPEGLPPYDAIKKYMPREFNEYRAARQHLGHMSARAYAARQEYSFLAGLVMVLAALLTPFFRQQGLTQLTSWLWFILLGLVVNAFVCSTFANVVDRLQARVVWLIPFMAVLVVLAYLGKTKKITI